MGFLQMQLTRVPSNFSVLKLFSLLHAQRDRPEWKRELLTTAVDDSLTSTKLLRVHVSTSNLESQDFWRQEVLAMVGLATFPTSPQSLELIKAIDILESRGATGVQICEWVAALDAKKRNKVMGPLLLKHVSTKESLCKGVTASMMATTLSTMREVFDLIGLLYGIALDDLRKDKWALSAKPKIVAPEPVVKKGKGFKAAMKAKRPPPAAAVPINRPSKPLKDRHIKAIALAMSQMTWLQLSDMYGPNKGLAKKLFEVVHINAVLLKLISKLAQQQDSKRAELRGARQALLAVLCLRGCPYPADASQWARFQEQVQEPLKHLDATNPLVKVDQRFLNPLYQPELAKLKLRIPHSRTVAAVLSQDGNTVETWDHLLNTRGTTAANVFQNWRSLVLLGYDAEKLFVFLEKRLLAEGD